MWTVGLAAAVPLGSRNLQNFDGALVAYLFGTLFACFGIVYRYAVWLDRPPTRLYWRAAWRLLFSRHFLSQLLEIVRRFGGDLVGQMFIFRRSPWRGVAHLLLSWGCLSAFAITLPLTFGWVHFTLAAGRTDIYVAHLFGFAAFEFPLHSLVALGLARPERLVAAGHRRRSLLRATAPHRRRAPRHAVVRHGRPAARAAAGRLGDRARPDLGLTS